MRFSWKRWQLALVAVLAAVALSIGVAGEAFAALNGEGNTFTRETVANGLVPVQSQDTISEATNNGHFMEVWRGETNNSVWLSLDHGTPFQIGGATTTFAHPVVIPWGTTRFAIFHTGTDGHIYWNFYDPGAPVPNGPWIQVPGQTTPNNMAVSAVRMGTNSEQIFLTYRSANNQLIWQTIFDGQTTWSNTRLVGGGGGGLTPSAPVAANIDNRAIMVAVRGTDNQIYTSITDDPTVPDDWSVFAARGGVTMDQPTIAANPDTGRVLLAHRGTDNRVYMREFNTLGIPTTEWAAETTGYRTLHPAFISVIAGIFYLLITGQDNGQVYWKPAWNGQ